MEEQQSNNSTESSSKKKRKRISKERANLAYKWEHPHPSQESVSAMNNVNQTQSIGNERMDDETQQ